LTAPGDYEPQGVETTLTLPDGTELPIYGPKSDAVFSKKAIIVLPEVFCWEGRLKGICDQLNAEGYYAILPDIMRGDTMSQVAEDGKMDFLTKWATWGNIEADVKCIFDHLAALGAESIGAIGFCWGAWVIHRASAAGFPLKAGAGCHPSVKLEGFTGGSPEALAQQVQCPMLFAAAGNDPDNVKVGGDVSKILMERFPTSVIQDYPDMSHGWVSRGDILEANVARDAKAALALCLTFFKSNL
jgi:dienelactone hydrolase